MDLLESDEHRDLRSAVGAIAASFGGSYYTEHARARTPCDELWTALGDGGFVGVNVAEEYGGGGGGLVELSIVCEEIASQGTPLLLLLVSAAISAEVIGEFGSPELRKEWLPGLASGRTKVVFAITEPDAGSNTHRLATTATRAGDEWVLRGTKHYISGIDEAAALMVVARSGRTPEGSPQLSLFVVPTEAPGLVATPLPTDILLPETQYVLHFDDVRVPGDRLLGGREGQGFAQAQGGLELGRINVAARGVGLASAALQASLRYSTERQTMGKPIGQHQAIQLKLADMACRVASSRLLVREAADAFDAGQRCDLEAGMAKLVATEAALENAIEAMRIHGAYGYSTDAHIERYYRDAPLLCIGEGTNEIQRIVIARQLLSSLPQS